MSTAERLLALCGVVVVGLIAAALFWMIKEGWENERRNDDLQERCIAEGGNWDYGCDMKPEVSDQ